MESEPKIEVPVAQYKALKKEIAALQNVMNGLHALTDPENRLVGMHESPERNYLQRAYDAGRELRLLNSPEYVASEMRLVGAVGSVGDELELSVEGGPAKKYRNVEQVYSSTREQEIWLAKPRTKVVLVEY